MTPEQEEAVNKRIHEEVMAECWHDAAGPCVSGMVIRLPTCSKCGIVNWMKNPNYLHDANAALRAAEKSLGQFSVNTYVTEYEYGYEVGVTNGKLLGLYCGATLVEAICDAIFAVKQWEWPK